MTAWTITVSVEIDAKNPQKLLGYWDSLCQILLLEYLPQNESINILKYMILTTNYNNWQQLNSNLQCKCNIYIYTNKWIFKLLESFDTTLKYIQVFW